MIFRSAPALGCRNVILQKWRGVYPTPLRYIIAAAGDGALRRYFKLPLSVHRRKIFLTPEPPLALCIEDNYE